MPIHNDEMEQSVIGHLLAGYNTNAIYELDAIYRPEMFYNSTNREIIETIMSRYRQGEVIDLISIGQVLKHHAHYLAQVSMNIIGLRDFEAYIRVLYELYMKRSMQYLAAEMNSEAIDTMSDPFELIDIFDKKLVELYPNLGVDTVPASQLIEKVKDDVLNNNPIGQGIKTGIVSYDQITYGLQDSDLIILAARPSVGKTALVLQIAANAALRENKNVLIFSLEMSEDQLVKRIISQQAIISANNLRSNELDEEEKTILFDFAKNKLLDNIHINDKASISTSQIRSEALKLMRKNGLGLIVVDYLQLIDQKVNNSSNRENDISHISRSLKILAKDLNIPVIALSQLNRAVETRRGGGRPQLSDLRESGSIEQDADLVMFLYRDIDVCDDTTDNINLIIAKHRNGALFDIPLKYIKEYLYFKEKTIEYKADLSMRPEFIDTPF